MFIHSYVKFDEAFYSYFFCAHVLNISRQTRDSIFGSRVMEKTQ